VLLLEEDDLATFDARFCYSGSNADWLINGDAETGACESGNGVTHPTGWSYNGTITQIYYNNINGDLNTTDPGPR
jgi:hypothetical protein